MINSCTCLSIAVVSEALSDWVVGFTQKCSNPLLAQCCDTFASSSSTASLSTASLFALTLTIASVLKLCPFDVSDFPNSSYNNVHIPQCNYNVEANHSVMTQSWFNACSSSFADALCRENHSFIVQAHMNSIHLLCCQWCHPLASSIDVLGTQDCT